MFIVIALLMGLVGSAHCAGMCGPLVMAYQHVLRSKNPIWLTLYHAGRFFGYASIATLGYSFHWALNFAGLQQYLSILSDYTHPAPNDLSIGFQRCFMQDLRVCLKLYWQ